MKKWIALCFVLVIAACGEDKKSKEEESKKTSKETTTSEVKAEEKNTAAKEKPVTDKKTKATDQVKKEEIVARTETNEIESNSDENDVEKDDDSDEPPYLDGATGGNPILSIKDVDAFTYLLVGSKGSCDKKVNYSKNSCDEFVTKVMDPLDRWFHIIKHYNIRKKHFYDQRVYSRMRKEIDQMGSFHSGPMRQKYGLKSN